MRVCDSRVSAHALMWCWWDRDLGIARMKATQTLVAFALILTIAAMGRGVVASSDSAVTNTSELATGASNIAPGTIITMQNWQNYRQFMPDGMAAMFEGKYFWKMPPDVQMEVGPTVVQPLPRNYQAASEKYSDQVRIIELSNGGLTLQGYRAGIPFPRLREPHKGWKVLMNLWYRYSPHLLVVTHGWTCAVNSSGNSNCETYQVVDRQLSYSTDLSSSPELPAPGAKYFTDWFMVLEPEQSKYTASLNIDYIDLTRLEEVYGLSSLVAPLSADGKLRALCRNGRYGLDSRRFPQRPRFHYG